MTSFSSEDTSTSGSSRHRDAPGSLFVGSFNINASDLSKTDAMAWLARAVDADVVAIGLQECAVLPAKPFPTPTNGKSVVMWQDTKQCLLSSGEPSKPISEEKKCMLVSEGECCTDHSMKHMDGDHGGSEGGKARDQGPGRPSLMAGMVQAAMRACSIKQASKSASSKQFIPPLPPVDVSREDGFPGSEISPVTSIDDSDRGLDRRERFAGSKDGGVNGASTAMRQESYYLRGIVEEERDANFLATIAACIPGRELVADVAMGETPTYGKIEVKLSPSRPQKTHANTNANMNGNTNANMNADSSDGDGADAGDEPAVESKSVEWYGTIRLLVFLRKELFPGLEVKTVVIPTGDKPSVVADAPHDYAKDTSPDKGAVACHLQDLTARTPLNLLLVNCHLYGTNKYCVPEAVFDKFRMAQLQATDRALRATLPCAAIQRAVLFGDINFRVEVSSAKEDKIKGGKDFQEVVQIAQHGESKELLSLYQGADRLKRLLMVGWRNIPGRLRQDERHHGAQGHAHGGNSSSQRRPKQIEQQCMVHEIDNVDILGDMEQEREAEEAMDVVMSEKGVVEEIPCLLEGLHDGLGEALAAGEIVRPTFTFKPWDTSHVPRRYNNKRTPSWPDRILWRGFAGHEQREPQEFSSVPEVIISDHEPVYCVLSLSCNSAV